MELSFLPLTESTVSIRLTGWRDELRFFINEKERDIKIDYCTKVIPHRHTMLVESSFPIGDEFSIVINDKDEEIFSYNFLTTHRYHVLDIKIGSSTTTRTDYSGTILGAQQRALVLVLGASPVRFPDGPPPVGHRLFVSAPHLLPVILEFGAGVPCVLGSALTVRPPPLHGLDASSFPFVLPAPSAGAGAAADMSLSLELVDAEDRICARAFISERELREIQQGSRQERSGTQLVERPLLRFADDGAVEPVATVLFDAMLAQPLAEDARARLAHLAESSLAALSAFVTRLFEHRSASPVHALALHHLVAGALADARAGAAATEERGVWASMAAQLERILAALGKVVDAFLMQLRPSSFATAQTIYRTGPPRFAVQAAALLCWALDAAMRKYPLRTRCGDVAASSEVPKSLGFEAVAASLASLETFVAASIAGDRRHGEKYANAFRLQCLAPVASVMRRVQPPPGALAQLLDKTLKRHQGVSHRFAREQFSAEFKALDTFTRGIEERLARGDPPNTIKLMNSFSASELEQLLAGLTLKDVQKRVRLVTERLQRQVVMKPTWDATRSQEEVLQHLRVELVLEVWERTSHYFAHRFKKARELLHKCYGPALVGHGRGARGTLPDPAFVAKIFKDNAPSG
eukprot:gnl/Chilomastix_cuspidata/2314.p2 GENE.gnl/Chilomastix_cuspidata/2314~~gnl/Chilomastix_cuspidata/2314.p2  ORF type:complete len:636 (+),score=241.19 gnl/Chilomastix_cuspidata/2314:54-1961(+)